MTKRIISIILAAAMLFSFPALAEDNTEVVKPDSGNMIFAKAMEIVPADAVGTNIVTRLDLAKMFCNIMRTDVDLAPNTGIEFTDVPEDASSVVANVAKMGIMNGVGGGLFAPDAPVTYVQAIKAMVTFLGYAQNAEAKNGYPFGYYAIAADLGLIYNAPKDMNTELTFEKAVGLFKLALNVDYRAPVGFNPEVKYEITKNLTYLHYHRDIVRVRGTVKSTSVYDISGMGTTAYNKIRIGSYVFTFNPAKVNAHEFFGYNIDAYVQADSEEILFIEDVGTNVAELKSTEISGLVGNNIEYYNEYGKVKKLEINTSFTRILYNGTVLGNYTPNDINPFMNSALEGGLTAIDNDNDGVYDIVCVDAYESYVVQRIVGNKIFGENDKEFSNTTNGIAVDLDAIDYKEGESFLIFNILGEPIKVSNIEDGNVISVSKDRNGRINRIVVTIDSVVGVLNATSEKGGRVYVTVNGGEFECSNTVKYALTQPQAKQIEMGSKVRLAFDKNGLVADIEQELYNIWSTGFLTTFGVVQGMDPAYQVKLYGEDGQWHIYTLAEKVYVNESTTASAAANFESLAGYDTDGKIKRQPIMYKVNVKGELSDVIFPDMNAAFPPFVPPVGTVPTDTAYKNALAQWESDKAASDALYLNNYETTKTTSPFYMLKASNGAKTAEVPADGINKLYWSHKDAGFNGMAFFSKSTTAFAIPEIENRDDDAKYGLVDPYQVYNDNWDREATVALYAMDPHPVVDVAVVVQSINKEIAKETMALIVENIEVYLDLQTGMDGRKITGYMGTKQYTYTDPENILATIGPNGTAPDKGDMIRLTVNGYGEITQADYAFDASEQEVYKKDGTKSAGGVSSDSYMEIPRYVYGKVNYIDSNFMTVDSTLIDGVTPVNVPYSLRAQTFVKVTKTGKGNITITPATVTDIIGSGEYGTADATSVVVQTQNGYGRCVVIYEGF